LGNTIRSLSLTVKGDSNLVKHTIYATQGNGSFVDVFIVFDESHTLTHSYNEKKESRFASLRRVLHLLRSESMFSFFLSTTGKVTQFSPPLSQESGRIYGAVFVSPRPYLFVGFDQLARDHKFHQGQTLDDVTSLCFNAHLGRPL
jgi:hypothetical protein